MSGKSCNPELEVYLEDALRLPILRVCKLLTDAEITANREITWVSVIEVPVGEFVRSGEFVLSTGMNVGHDANLLSRFIADVAGAKPSALALAVGPYTPSVPDQVIKVANQMRLPLIELPWETRFSEISEVILKRLLHDESAKSSRDQLVWLLATGQATHENVSSEAKHLSFNHETGYVGIVGRVISPVDEIAEMDVAVRSIDLLCTECARHQQLEWVSTTTADCIIGYLQAPSTLQRVRSLLNTVQARVKSKHAVAWGIGRPCSQLADFRSSYEDAHIACEVASGRKSESCIKDVSEILADRVLVPICRDGNVSLLVERYVTPLVHMSRVPLLSTLETFFENDCNVSETARKLTISRQSLLNRLSSVENLLHVDLRSSDTRFAISLSLRLYRLQRTLKPLPSN